ncbi:LamG-like jellyroll fold domain-containing protein [Rubritalea sp.]|uniref:LamG-like jellyroll fold domain-containing protein n=1 Tax=Rubritalea sp. TaxID=2109375 RepID=UPI003EF32923
MKFIKKHKDFCVLKLLGLAFLSNVTPCLGQFEAEIAQVEALGTDSVMLNAPNVYEVEYDADGIPTYGATYTPMAGDLKRIFYDGLDTEGNPTRVFAWINIPANASSANPVPGVVLVHGGGGTAYQGWAEQWEDRGYAAIAITTEGHTDIRYDADVYPSTTVRTSSGYIKHELSGPSRNFYSSRADLTAEWMYHATANTILANSLLRDLDFVDEDKCGVMGVSWGGVITSTAIGIDDRFAFAIPVYGCGHKFSSSNLYGSRLGNHEKYNLLWDPFLRMQNATTPALWLSWPTDKHFPMDSQAYTYQKQAGVHSVAIVHGMGHSNPAAEARPEPIDYADSIVENGAPWSSQKSISISGSEVTVVFNSTKNLHTATLLSTSSFDVTTTDNSNNTGWSNVLISAPVNNGDGTYTVTTTIPETTTAYFINAFADPTSGNRDLTVSSDYQEIFEVTLSPSGGLSIPHPEDVANTVGTIEVSIDGPSNLPVVDIALIDASHPGAFSTTTEPFLIAENTPSTTPIEIVFDNTVANLDAGQSASATVQVTYELTDGSLESVTLPVTVSGSGGPVASWSMDDGDGSQVADDSGHGYHATLTNGTWVTGVENSALSFNGTDSAVTLPSSAFSSISDQITISMWVNGDASQAKKDTAFYAEDSSGNRVLNIHLPWSNGIVYWDAGNTGSQYDRINKGASASEYKDQWNHWAFTKNASTGEMAIYLNGELWHSGTGKARSMAAIANVMLGNDVNNNSYDGMIDEVQVYDVALSASEVSDLANSYTATNDTPKVWLIANGVDPTNAGALADADGDGSANWQEYQNGTDPLVADNSSSSDAGIRVTEYYLTTGDFTGTQKTLVLDQNLADDYFILVRGSRDGNGKTLADSEYARVTGVPYGGNRYAGDMVGSGNNNQITLTRSSATQDWEGVVTIVECMNPTDAGGFDLIDVASVDIIGNSGAEVGGSWTDINQVVLFGGYRGGGVNYIGAPTTGYDNASAHTRFYPSGSNTINWTRNSAGEALLDVTATAFVVEWGSDWNVQHRKVVGSNGGNGADATGEYITVAIDPVSRENTWVWGTGTRLDSGVGDGAEACLVTLGDGVNQNATESIVAVGSEYTDTYWFDVYTMTHPDLHVDYGFKTDGNVNDTDVTVAVDSASAGTRFGWVYNGCNATGDSVSRAKLWSRYTEDDEVTLSRGYSGQNFPAWIQGIDFSGLNN